MIYLHGSTTVHSMHCVLSFAQINFYFVFIFCLYCLYFVCFILIIEDINIACSCVFFPNIWNATIPAAKNVCVSYVSDYYIVWHVAISKERDGVTIFNFTTKTCFFYFLLVFNTCFCWKKRSAFWYLMRTLFAFVDSKIRQKMYNIMYEINKNQTIHPTYYV